MSYQEVELEELILSGISCKTTNENQQCIADMGQLWGRFFQDNIMAKIKNGTNYNSYGLYFNYEADLTKPYEYMASMEVSDVNQVIETIKVAKGKYAKFEKTGEMIKVVGELWQEVWQTELKRTYKYDFEKYHYTEDKENQLVEIFIGIE